MSITCYSKQSRENIRKSKSILSAFDLLYSEINKFEIQYQKGNRQYETDRYGDRNTGI